MSTTSQTDASTPSSSRKRKSDGSDSDRPVKQSKKISHYFSPLYPVSSNSKEGESQPVPLNEEQKRVLEMVVDEGKNVFFTGAAGTFFYLRSRHPIYLAYPLTDLVFALARDGKVVTAPGDHRGPEEEIRKETGRRLCYG